MWRLTLLALTFLLLCPFAFSQSTTVSGTIIDGGGQAWFGGTYSFVFLPNPAFPTNTYIWSGGSFSKNLSGQLNGSGAYSAVLPSNNAITPQGSSWSVQFCPQASSVCTTPVPLSLVSPTLTYSPIPLAILISLQNAVSPISAYTDSEITGTVVGSTYYNLTLAQPRICLAVSGNTCVSWAAAAVTSATNLTGPGTISGTFGGNYTTTGSVTGSGSYTFNSAMNANAGGILAGTFTGNPTLSGNPTFSGTTTFTNTLSAGNINATLWVCPVCQYTTLAAAITAAPSTGALIYEPLAEAFVANPFPATGTAKGVTVQLGCGTWTTSALIEINARSILRGCGRGDAGAFGTTIQATAGWATANSVKSIIQLGDAAFSSGSSTGTIGAFGTRLENINIDCNGVANTVGIYSESINEQSGAFFFKAQNCPSAGVFIDGAHAQADGNIASDYNLDNGEIVPQSFGASGTVFVKIQGGTAGPHGISNITGIGNSGARSTNGFQFDNLAFGTIRDLHAEQCVNCFAVGTVGISVGTNYLNISAKNGTNVLTIGNNANRTSNFFGVRNQGGITNTINDLQNSFMTANSECAGYILDLNGKAIHNCNGGWVTPSIQTSAVTNSTGIQLFNTTTTCTTAATINTPCTTAAITLPVAYADTNYRLSVMCLGPTQFPQVQTVTKSNTTFTITLNNLTAAATTCSSFDISAVHN